MKLQLYAFTGSKYKTVN